MFIPSKRMMGSNPIIETIISDDPEIRDRTAEELLSGRPAEELIRLTQQAVLDLTHLRQNQPDADQWQSILTLLERDASWEQKLKFSLPIFPFLSFESEVKVDVLDALKEGWQRLARRVRVSGRS